MYCRVIGHPLRAAIVLDIYRIPSFNCLLLPRPLLLGVRTGARPDERRIGDWGETARDTEHRLLVLIKFDGTLRTSVSTEEMENFVILENSLHNSSGKPRDVGVKFELRLMKLFRVLEFWTFCIYLLTFIPGTAPGESGVIV